MKERGILYTGPMVRAILDDHKDTTRRIVKPQSKIILHENGQALTKDGWLPELDNPYGGIGDRLWVKETFCECRHCGQTNYVATINKPRNCCACDHSIDSPNKPSIFMPRRFSRITLEILSVLVERLQDITAKSILAEGAVFRPHIHSNLGKCPVSAFDGKVYVDLRSLWAAGWDSINKKRGYGWDTNPWVWVIKFKRV